MPAVGEPAWSHRRDVHGVPTLFLYSGGSYVEVKPLGHSVDVIDVWDYDRDEARIRSEWHLRSVVDLWVRDLDRREWRHSYCLGIAPCDCGICRFRSNRQAR